MSPSDGRDASCAFRRPPADDGHTLHVYHSQYARYWSLVFLLSAVYPFAIYLGIRDRNPGALALGLLTGVLALLAHPVSALLVGGLGGWIMVIHLKRDQLTPLSLWKQRNARWLALGVVVLAGAVVAWYRPVLRSRVLAHGGGRPTEHFLFFPGR